MCKSFFFICSFLLLISNTNAQKNLHAIGLGDISIYTSLKEAYRNPNDVEGLVLKKNKLKKIPIEKLRKFPNLVYLDLSKNKIDSIPEELGEFTKLQVLILNNNNISKIPEELYNLTKLKFLFLGKNNINYVSHNIKNLTGLIDLDLWSNDILRLPPEIQELRMLKKLDLRLTSLSKAEQQKIKNWFGEVNIMFSNTCDCD